MKVFNDDHKIYIGLWAVIFIILSILIRYNPTDVPRIGIYILSGMFLVSAFFLSGHVYLWNRSLWVKTKN